MNLETYRHTPGAGPYPDHRLALTDKALADLCWRLRWRSQEAHHIEEYFGRMNIWRDLELLPPALGRRLRGLAPGDRLAAAGAPGELIPAFDPDRVRFFPRRAFAGGTRPPRSGRFYPRNLLPGDQENTLPFRCVQVDQSSLAADFNHPLAGRELRLELDILDVVTKRSDCGGACQDWLELLTWGPGMQARGQGGPTDFFSEEPFHRPDERQDAVFYARPRLVSHVDSRARQTLAELYGRLLAPGTEVLDLMSSWQSHLPDSLKLSRLVGLGLNQAELEANPRLTERLVWDVNADPRLPLPDRSLDAVICTVSVEYLTRPVAVFREVSRVLRPRGIFAVSFSNRWFPLKVVRIWTELSDFERLGLVQEYFLATGSFGDLMTYSSRGWPRPEDDRHFPQVRLSDPIFAAWGRVV